MLLLFVRLLGHRWWTCDWSGAPPRLFCFSISRKSYSDLSAPGSLPIPSLFALFSLQRYFSSYCLLCPLLGCLSVLVSCWLSRLSALLPPARGTSALRSLLTFCRLYPRCFLLSFSLLYFSPALLFSALFPLRASLSAIRGRKIELHASNSTSPGGCNARRQTLLTLESNCLARAG